MNRYRIAPSPTGKLHIGTLRTALFNWILARKNRGKFILRIEDTDIKRSSKEMVDVILKSLKWVGLDWDEGPYFQSERKDIYKKYAQRLIDERKAYYCYCTSDEIQSRKQKAISEHRAWKYDRRCYNLTPVEREQFEKENRKRAVRIFIPEGTTSFDDLIHGKITRENSEIEDFVILKSDGTPSYNFAVVVDDHSMNITDVLRGDDHISNTSKQIILYRALGWELPRFGHLPLILGRDKSKLSKRHGAVGVTEYKKDGYLPDALINYLALLGWSPPDEKEILTKKELIERFSIERINKKGAVFDIEKLKWVNSEYIRMMPLEKLGNELIPFLKEGGLYQDEILDKKRNWYLQVLGLMRERIKTLKDFIELGSFFFTAPKDYAEKGKKKYFKVEFAEHLEYVKKKISDLPDVDKEHLEDVVRASAEELGVHPKYIIHPLRLAVTGLTFGPGLFELMELLDKNDIIRRIEKMVYTIKS